MTIAQEDAVMAAGLRDANPRLVAALLEPARNLLSWAKEGGPLDVLAGGYRDGIRDAAVIPAVEVDRAFGAIIRFCRATGFRREAQILSQIVRRSRRA